jgi:hypothetical protein
VEEKKKSDSEFLSYNLMLNSGRKFRSLRDKKINILTLVLSEKKFMNETKNHNPPFKLNGRSLRQYTKKKEKKKKEKRINTFGDVCWLFRSFRQL